MRPNFPSAARLAVLLATWSASISSAAADDQAYDYIIVGGGTAGNAVAARLSLGLPSASILLIEAGPAAPGELNINIPGKKGTTLGTKYDWNFTTVAQPGLKNRTLSFNRGKVLGGSSALNLMVYDKAAVVEYDAWEEVGNPGWNWNSVSAAMIKSENYTGGPAGSGTDGPVHAVVNRIIPRHQDPFIPAVTAAFTIPENEDSLQGNPIGVMLQPSSVDPTNYNRSYSANAYLPLAEGAANLQILTDTTVTRINLAQLNETHQRASGVVLADGTTITANREVILSAGSVGTPGLLELSGIGQSAVITAAGVTPVIDLPGVGENLQDHLRVSLSYQLTDNFTSFDVFKYNTSFAASELDKWLANEVSLWDYTASGYVFANWAQVTGDDSTIKSLAREAVGDSTDPGLLKKLAFLDDASVPQVEMIFSDGYNGLKGYPAAGSALFGSNYFALIGGLMHPLSRGSIHINPADPLGKPIIDPKYLDNEADVQGMVAIAKFARAIAEASPLKAVWATEYEPGLDVVQTDDQWRDFVLSSTLSIFHPIGTAVMLPKDQGGVVDPSLRVYGTSNLRVVDASVFPVQISAHIQSAIYGIAERAADAIIADFSTGPKCKKARR